MLMKLTFSVVFSYSETADVKNTTSTTRLRTVCLVDKTAPLIHTDHADILFFAL